MTSGDRHAVLVALLRRTGLLTPGIAERVERHGPGDALAQELGAATSLIPEDPAPLIATAERDMTRWRDAGLRLVSVIDDAYPANLRTVHDRPALLFVAGDLTPAENVAVAVVGARRASEAGLAQASAVAADLVAGGHTVLSGLAAGIDTAAHRGALGAGGRTVAVIGTGHGHAYPPENEPLQRELARHHAVVSALWPETPPSADGFRHRNGLMSGLSRGTVIAEASVRSGTRVQARLALAHGRPVFLLAPLLAQEWAAELARRPGVHVVQDAGEVVAITGRLADPGPLSAPGPVIDPAA